MYRILIILFLLLTSQIIQAEITVMVDRNPVTVDESFQLIFESSEKVDARPDFSPLNKSFTILNNSQRSNTQIINGKITQSQQWILTLIANKKGVLSIPAISFGKKSSKAVSIKVVAAKQSSAGNNKGDIFIEVEASSTSPYVQQQVVYTIKLFRAVATNNASLSEPNIVGGQVVIEKLGEDKSFETRLNGKRYVVIQRQYVIYPQSSGQFRIEPIVFQGQVGGGSFFNFDPFGPQAKSIVKRSPPIELNVKPIPDSFTGKTWLPAKSLTIKEQWSVAPDKLIQGEATTRTLILQANRLAASHLPAIENVLPDSLKQYPDQPEFEEINSNDGLTGIRRDKMAIIPSTGGSFKLPAIRIPWWNTVTDKMEVAELPERTLKVEASELINPDTTTSQVQTEGLIESTNDKESESFAENQGINSSESSYWKWISLILLIIWLVTLYFWWYSARQKESDTIRKDISTEKIKTVLKELKQACKSNDPKMTREKLLQWARCQWSDKTISSTADIKQYADDDFHIQLERLNQHLYSKDQTAWDGLSFLSSFEAQTFKENINNKSTGRLEPLYKT